MGQTEAIRNTPDKTDSGLAKLFLRGSVFAAFSVIKIKLQPKDDLKVEAKFQIVFMPFPPKRP